ncbi:hypothetical protein C9F11_42955 (plasmid) [Streptomyces sp. YIM 121038]|uniref:hypothetical protein n=1 Tax=Streptomyces sp. YIM 121038 TaxID=2136401 RepID=UPI0011101926|nr:hypothetical protein [Streptomyces sp. YIM 121038]QCX82171.1 hypothetical protein C9F11_42955 [Streptomyces sp. YIM 121038]
MSHRTRSHNTLSASATDEGSRTLQSLNSDWAALADDSRACNQVAAWAAEDSRFAGARSPQDVVDAITGLFRRGAWEDHDQAMLFLLRHAQGTGAERDLAWRTAARVMLPKAVSMAKTQQRDGVLWDDIVSAAFASLFEVVGTYPLERRPRGVFANIAMDTLVLTQKTLAADYDNRDALREIGDALLPLAGDRSAALLPAGDPDPVTQAHLADCLVRAVELEIVSSDEPELCAEDPRAELLSLVMWAVDIQALKVSDAQRIASYYLDVPATPGRTARTRRSMGSEGARLRQRASRAVRPLRQAVRTTLPAAA